jgi:hypothetical protein
VRPLLATHDPDQLRTRLRRDGYVYLPRFLDPAEIGAIEADVRGALHQLGWLAHPGDLRPSVGVTAGFSPAEFRAAYESLQQLESLHRLAHTPGLRTVVATLLEDEIFCHPAKTVRIGLPTGADRLTTQAHQDFVKLHVAVDVLVVWIALTPCTADRQGLRILANSHLDGFLLPDPALGRSLPVYLPVAPDDPRWLTADYQAGDVVVFHSLTVHGGGPNTTDRIRLSVDVRYQRCSDPMRPEYAMPHGWPRTPGWEELGRDWTTDRWIRMPAGVDLIPMPEGVSFWDYLTTLAAPHSRLLAAEAGR